MNNSITFLFCSFLLLTLTACNKDRNQISTSHSNEENFLLLEINYENNAWGNQFYSRFINDEGEEKIFIHNGFQTNTDYWNRPDEMGYISKEDLLENYNRADSLVRQIPTESLTQLNNGLAGYSGPVLDPPKGFCNDFGEVNIRTYRWDQNENAFQMVLIKTCGDYFQKNRNLEADPITDWVSDQQLITEWYCCE